MTAPAAMTAAAVHPFSPEGRRAALHAMAREEYDLLIVGGGITGSGLARDAALRGLTTALVEKADFGYGTSSRSSKLVHGGIRYLAHGEVGLVRESARERTVLRSIAPHLVHPLPFLFPLYKGESVAKFRAGFWLFDKLAAAAPQEEHRFLDAAALRARLPTLHQPAAGAVEYGEYITDDARFTLENALSAAQHGARVANHAPLVSFLVQGGRLAGGRVQDAFSGRTFDVRARVVVNATGPWAEETVRLGATPPLKRLLPSKGVHLLFRAERLPLEGAIALRSPSGREGFAIRRWNFVYVGTSDVAHHGRLDGPTADRAAVLDVLGMARDCFPGLDLQEQDIVATWAGLRPLIAEAGRSPRDTSRHDEVWRSPEGLLTIAGGKLTTYRPMACRVMAHVARELGRDLGSGRLTAQVPLPGGELGGQSFAAFRQAMTAELLARGVSAQAAERVTWLYGNRVRDLLAMGDQDSRWLQPLAEGVAALRGEVRLAVEQEMAGTLADFMDRRSSLLIFSEDHGLGAAEPASCLMAERLGWSEEHRRAQVEEYRELASRHSVPVQDAL